MEHQQTNEEQLLAENLRLKRLISRFSDKEMSNGHLMASNGQAPAYLPLAVSQALSSNIQFGERIKNTLQLINLFVEAEHIVLFHFNKNSKGHVILEGSGQQINLSFSNRQIQWKPLHDFLQSIGNDIYTASGTKKDFTEVLQPFLSNASQNTSLMLLPITSAEGATGFLAFEESSFVREWFSFEKDILALVTNQLSNSFQHNRDQIDLEKKEALNNYLLKIAETFSQNDRFEIQARKTLEITAQFFGFSRVLLFENTNNDICRITDEWFAPQMEAIKDLFQDISYSRNLTGLKELLHEKKVITCNEEETKIACQYLNTGSHFTKLIFPIHTVNQFHGFLLIDDSHRDRNWYDDEKNSLIVLSDFFASAFERQHAMDHMVASHQEAIRLTKSLTEKEHFLESILSSVPVGISVIRNREIMFANRIILEQSGITESEMIGRHLSDFYFNKEIGIINPESFYQQIHQNGIGTLEVMMRNHEGLPIHVHVIGKHCPLNGHKDTYLLISQDITLLRQAQTDLLESEERSRKILETSIEGVIILDSPEKICYLNKAAIEMLGYEGINNDEISLFHIFGTGKELRQFHQAIAFVSQNKDYKSDTRIWTKDGIEIFVEIFGTSIYLKGKKQYYFSLRNITDRKNHELALQASEKKFRSLTENTTDQIIRLSKDGVLLFANPAFIEYYDITESPIIGLRLNMITQFPTAFASSLDKGCKTLKEKSEMTSFHTEATAVKNSATLSVEWRISPETNPHGEIESFLCSGRDVTQRKFAEQELRVTKEKAVSADRLKSAFLANLSHEVRTPLNAIVGFSTLLKESDTSAAEREEFVNIITRSSDHLMSLISDIVDIAKIESGELTVSKASFDINNLLKDIYLVFQKRIKLEKQHAIEQLILELPTNYDNPVIVSDATRLTQIFNSLLDNAIKFTPKGVITFGYVIDSGMFRFFVKDTGIGIDNEKLNFIFQPFRQGDESISKKYGGTGLGLSISRKLTEALGGAMHVHSIPEEGSEFFFEIPDIHQHKPRPEQLTQLIASHELEAPSQIHYHWSDKIVLLIDDNSSVHLLIRKFLEKTGVTLISARTGASARELIKNHNIIDLVITSVQMPDLNGIEFICLVRQYRFQIPVFAISDANNNETVENYASSGYDEVFIKPLEHDSFMKKMNHHLKIVNRQKIKEKVSSK